MFSISYLFVFQPYGEPKDYQYGEKSEIPNDAYLVKAANGYVLYDSSGKFIADISYIDDSLSNLKIIE